MWALWALLVFVSVSCLFEIEHGIAGRARTIEYDALNVLEGCIFLALVYVAASTLLRLSS